MRAFHPALSQASDGRPRAMFLGLFGLATGLNGTLVTRHIRELAVLRIARPRPTAATASDRHPRPDPEPPSHRMVKPLPLPFILAAVALLGVAGMSLGTPFFLGGAAGVIAECRLRSGLTGEARRGCENVRGHALQGAELDDERERRWRVWWQG